MFQVAKEYNLDVLLPMSLIIYKALTPYFINIEPIGFVVLELGVFGLSICGLIKVELSIFDEIVVTIDPFSPLN